MDVVPTQDVPARRHYAVRDPASGEAVERVPDGGAAEAMAALDAVWSVRDAWRRTGPRVRAEILERAAGLVVARSDALAGTLTAESGKPLAEARAELRYAADHLRWAAAAAERLHGTSARAPAGDALHLTTLEPVGPCLLITPWNFPAAMVTRKVGPAIAAGCTMILKPAEQTPLTALALARVLAEAGLPEGVLEVVTGADPAAIVSPLLVDGRLRKLSFTGSEAVGRQLLAQAADNVLNVSMELGGNAPFVVFEDADLDRAVAGAVVAKLRNAGQACTAANRFFVHATIHHRFVERFAAAIGALRLGPGGRPETDIGPLIDERQRRRVEDLVLDAERRGATRIDGGQDTAGPGTFFAPTLLVDVPGDARVLDEEIFGPVAPVVAFSREDELHALLNRSRQGLASYIYTRDLQRALRTAAAVEAGLVGVNRAMVSDATLPFGGVKHSGLGREGGVDGVREYVEVKALAIADA